MPTRERMLIMQELYCTHNYIKLTDKSVPTPKGVSKSGWVRNKRIECPFFLGFYVCAVCIRSGFDFRYHFCPVGRAGDDL